MNIIFKNIKLHNFLSMGDAELNLDNNGYVLVSGVNNYKEDLAQSNGSGKSSCFEGIFYALTGETIRGSKDVKNIHTDDGCVVDLTFDIDGKEFRILRSKDSKQWKTTVKLWVDGNDVSGKGVRDTNALIQQYLPDLNGNLIGSVIIMGQGLPHRFSNNTPSGRKEVLEKLSKSDFMIEDLKNKISARKIFLQEELRKYEDAVLSDTSKQRILTSQKEKAELELSSININDLQSFIKSKETLETEISKLEEEISKLDEKPLSDELNTCNEQLRNLSKIKWDETNSVDSNHESELLSLQIEIQQLQTSATLLLSEIKRNDSVKDVCPTCGQKLIGVQKIDTTEKKLKYKELVESMTKKQSELKLIKDTIISEKTKILEKYTEEEEKLTKKSDIIKNMIDNIRRDKNELSRKVLAEKSELHSVEVSISKFDANIEALKRVVEDTSKQINELSEKILYNSSERDKVSNHLSVVNKFNTVIARDFRGVLLEDVISYIETKSKEYSKIVFNTENVKFVLDGNNIRIIYDDKDYENLSGGEKQKIDLIVQLAIRDMLCKYLNLSVNIIVADEVFDNVDAIGCQNILTLLSNCLKDVSSTYIITHHANDLAIPYDKEIIVTKNSNGISEIN